MLLPLGDLRGVPGDGVGTDGDRSWQDSRFHLAPDGRSGPSGGLDHSWQAQEFSGRGHGVLLHFVYGEWEWRSGADCADSPWLIICEGGPGCAPWAEAVWVNKGVSRRSLEESGEWAFGRGWLMQLRRML